MHTIILNRHQVCQGPLILINSSHPLSKHYSPDLVCLPDSSGVLMERHAAHLLSACVQAAKGTGQIVPVSGYRSHTEQQAIWDDTMATNGVSFTEKYVAPPGCSEHQTGLAIDLGRLSSHIDFIRPDFPDEGVCGVFRSLSVNYGFIERYKDGKQSITGIAPEPWHFRYVGIPHARLMEEHGLTLEEYSDFLSRRPWRYAQERDRRAIIFYVPCLEETTAITIPDCCYQISGDNQQGFIITLWEAGE